MGLFINTLPLRVDVEDASIEDSVRKIQIDLAGLLEHEHASLAMAQRCSSVPAGTPLFSSLLNYRHNSAPPSEASSITGIESVYAQDRTNYPFMMSVEDGGETLGLTAQVVQPYDSPRICAYMHQALQSLVDALDSTPNIPVQDLDILPVEERDMLIQSWNAVGSNYPDGVFIHQLFEDQVEQSPDAIALVYEDRVFTYRDLNARANSLAHHLIDIGVKPETLVALCVDRSPAIVVGILAILKAGGAYVPLDPVYASERLLDILDDISPSILLADRHGRETLGEVALSQLTVVDPNMQMEGSVANPMVSSLKSHHLAYVIYTSGSTGKPKGVMVEHAHITRLFDATDAWYGFQNSDTWIMTHSFSFDVSVWEMWGALRYGGKLVVPSHHITQSPEDMYKLICEHGITVLNMTPSSFRLLIRSHAESNLGDKLRYVILAGEALEPATLQP
ncbi:hypothetical protein BGZ80_007688, partial [Entomortierella chlamydospora]